MMSDDNREGNQDKVVLVSDYGRSGQGWLSYMLCYVLNAKYIEPYDLLKGRLYTSSQHVLDHTNGNMQGRDKTCYSMIVKTHNYPDKQMNLTDKVILLRRDPRDVAVSAYLRKKNINNNTVKLGLKSRIHLALHRMSFVSYALTVFGWVNFYEAWSGIECHHVTYEDMSRNTKGELRRMLDYLDINASDKLLEEAVEMFSFRKITGRDKGEEVIGNSEFRKGVVGDFRNHISRNYLKICKMVFGNRLAKQGYQFE